MRIEDLMLNDWVLFHDSGWSSDGTTWQEDRACQVESISEDAITVKWADEDGYVESSEWVLTKDIEPIPLTPEILEKNGFEYYHKNFASLNQDDLFKLEMIEWPDENGIGGIWKIGIIEIRYVYELQHALRLCGIEKEIVL